MACRICYVCDIRFHQREWAMARRSFASPDQQRLEQTFRCDECGAERSAFAVATHSRAISPHRTLTATGRLSMCVSVGIHLAQRR
jgi:hypothetical protein